MSEGTPEDWVRICRIEAMRTAHIPTRDLLLELAAEYEALASSEVGAMDPDDFELQSAVADRLQALAMKMKASLPSTDESGPADGL